MRDANLLLRSGTTDLTATETTAGVIINGTPAGGLACVMIVEKKSIGDTLQLKVQHSTDDSTYTDLVTDETIASVTEASTVSFRRVKRFHTRNKYVRAELTVAGTSPNFGGVVVTIGQDDLPNTPALGQFN